MISAAAAAKMVGLNPEYAARLAKRAHLAGSEWPKKRGRYWQAPLSEWERILSPSGRVRRKKRKRLKEKREEPPVEGLLSATQAAKRWGISKSWASELARRCHRMEREWPKRLGRYWMAPWGCWQEIFEDARLKSWSRSPNV